MSRKTRKLMWSVPLIAAVAVIGALAAFMTLQPGSLFADELPDAPMNLKVMPASGNEGRTTLVLTWEMPESGAPDMYRIDVSTDNQKFTNLTEIAGSMTTYSHVVRPRGMDREGTAGWLRYYRVYAMNSHGYGVVSTSESATTKKLAVPGEVTNVTGSSGDPTYNTLSWMMPDDGGSDILGYCIFAKGPGDDAADSVGVNDTNCRKQFLLNGPGKSDASIGEDPVPDPLESNNGDVIRILPATTYTHKSLKASQDWEYQVYAFNRYGHSGETSGTRDVTTLDAREPTAPAGLKLVQGLTTTGGPEINVYWNAPDAGGQDITSYRVEVTTERNSWPETLTDSTAANFDALSGAGAKDSTINLVADTVDTDAFVGVVTLTVATQTDAEPYQLQHTIPETPPGDATTWRGDTLYYRVQTVTNNGDQDNELMSPFSDEVSITIADDTATTPVIEYAVVDSDGDPIGNRIAQPMIDADADDGVANSGDTSTAANLDDEATPADDDNTPGVIKLNITSSSAGADSYRVDISTNAGMTWKTVHGATLPISQTEYQHRGLDPEKRLHFRLFGKKGSVIGLASNVVLDYAGNTDQPGPVQDLLASGAGAGNINLTWNAPADDGGAEIEQYCIIANKLDSNDAPVSTGDDLKDRSDIVTNMVREDDADSCTRLGEPDLVPIGGVGNSEIFQVDADTTMVSFKGLEQKTRWQFEVFALNDASDSDVDNNAAPDTDNLHGVSAESDVQKAGTSAAVVPGAPLRLTAQLANDTNAGQQGVLILWNPPSNPPGAPVEKYKIERMIDDGDYITRRSSHTAGITHWVDPDEPPAGEVWTYRVSAINAVGTGTDTATVMIPYPGMHTHNMAPTTVGTIGAQSVMMGATSPPMDVSGYFRDPDGDMLSYSSMSDNTAVATVNATGNPVMVTGVAVGTANITVKAMDPDGAYAEQMFRVTVTEAMLTAPTNAMARVDDSDPGEPAVVVTWTDGLGAAQHAVLLFDENWEFGTRIATNQTDGTTTFMNVPSGDYTAVVVALDADYEMAIDAAEVTVP